MIIVFTKCGFFKNGFKDFREKYICDCTSFSHVLYADEIKTLRERKAGGVKAMIIDYEQADIALLIALVEVKTRSPALNIILITREARFANTIENILINSVADYTLSGNDTLRKLELILRDLHCCHQHRVIVKNSVWYNVEKNTNLTKKESVVLPYIISGKNNKEISRYLNLSQKTVSYHRRSIYGKFKVNNLIGLFNTFNHIR